MELIEKTEFIGNFLMTALTATEQAAGLLNIKLDGPRYLCAHIRHEQWCNHRNPPLQLVVLRMY